MTSLIERVRRFAMPKHSEAVTQTIESFTQAMNSMKDQYVIKTAELKQVSAEEVKTKVEADVRKQIEAAWQNGF